MRKIEQLMNRAIANKIDWALDNTRVEYQPEVNTEKRSCLEYSRVYLHGHHIGTYVHTLKDNHGNNIQGFVVNKNTLANWPTNTTKSRLRALGANVTTKKGVTYLDGVAV